MTPSSNQWSIAASPISPAKQPSPPPGAASFPRNDVVGIKVFSAAGEIDGTRPAVVAAVVHGLLDAGLPTTNIIIWDRHADDLRAAGFFKLGQQLGVRAAGAVETGYDPTNFYLPDSPVIGNLVWGDLEFGKKGDGRRQKILCLQTRQPANHKNHQHRAAAQSGGRRHLRPSFQPRARQRGQHVPF